MYTVTHTRTDCGETYTFDAPHKTRKQVSAHVADLLIDLDERDISSITITKD